MFSRITFLILLSLFLVVARCAAQTTLTPVDDTYVYVAGPKAAQAYGVLDPDTLKTRKSVSSDEFTRETYVKFHIGSPDTTFISAKVRLYGIVQERKTTQVCFSDTTWKEATLTGNTRPAGTFITDAPLEPGEGYYSWDVTTYLNQAVAEGRQYVSFVFKDIAGAVSTKDTRWHSKENLSGKPPLLEMTAGPPVVHRKGNYYIDDQAGDDINTAATPMQAWKSLDRINAEIFEPGDSILFRCNGSWRGQLAFKGSGAPGKPIVAGSYGTGEKPLIGGGGLVENTIQINGQQYIEIQDLHVTNRGDTAAFRKAIYVHAEDMGAVRHLVFRRLEISDVNGAMEPDAAKNNGGMFIDITGSSKLTYFDTLIIEYCYIHDVDRTGISNRSSWSDRTLNNNVNWVPSKSIIIRFNTFERTGGNGLIVRVAEKPLMEHNLFTHCAIKGSGNACFSFNTNDALWQFNEACYTKYNTGDDDAGGFDSDYDSKNTILQYNYSHDNEYGAMLLTGGPASVSGFNDGTIVRYNVFANNHNHEFRTSGKATNSLIYNNTIYSDSSHRNIVLVWHKSWDGYSANTKYYNNIFKAMGQGASVNLGSSTGNLFDYNIFYDSTINYLPVDAHKIILDPDYLSPDDPGTGVDSLPGFRLLKSSPAINSGKVIDGAPDRDFEGNPVPIYNIPDRGAFEYNGPYGIRESLKADGLKIYPNPATGFIRLEYPDAPAGKNLLELITMDGRQVLSREFFTVGGRLEYLLPVEGIGAVSGFHVLKLTLADGSVKESLVLIHKP